jgi:hypothetical protein
MSPQEVNHLNLRRELYLDFARDGFTVIDHVSGQMRSGWRLDMRSPYRLMRATSGADNLLVTQADGAAPTGVELRAAACPRVAGMSVLTVWQACLICRQDTDYWRRWAPTVRPNLGSSAGGCWIYSCCR